MRQCHGSDVVWGVSHEDMGHSLQPSVVLPQSGLDGGLGLSKSESGASVAVLGLVGDLGLLQGPVFLYSGVPGCILVVRCLLVG